jgi:hypothetical protein
VTTTHNACALIKEEPDHHVPRRRLPSRSSSCPALWPGFAWWIRALRSIRCTGGQRIRCGVRTGRRALRVQAGGARQPHPHLFAHEFHMNGFTWEYFGLLEDRGYRDAQKNSPKPESSPIRGTTARSRIRAPTGTRLPPGPAPGSSASQRILPRLGPRHSTASAARRTKPSPGRCCWEDEGTRAQGCQRRGPARRGR